MAERSPGCVEPVVPLASRCVFLHSKYTLISGGFGDQRNQNIVVTGSENWNAPGLHNNDESMVQISERSKGADLPAVRA